MAPPTKTSTPVLGVVAHAERHFPARHRCTASRFSSPVTMKMVFFVRLKATGAHRDAMRRRLGRIEHRQHARGIRAVTHIVTWKEAARVAVFAQPEKDAIEFAHRLQRSRVPLCVFGRAEFGRHLRERLGRLGCAHSRASEFIGRGWPASDKAA